MERAPLLNQLAVQPSTHHLLSLGLSFFTCRMNINKMDRYKTSLKFLRYFFGGGGGIVLTPLHSIFPQCEAVWWLILGFKDLTGINLTLPTFLTQGRSQRQDPPVSKRIAKSLQLVQCKGSRGQGRGQGGEGEEQRRACRPPTPTPLASSQLTSQFPPFPLSTRIGQTVSFPLWDLSFPI